MEKYREIKIKIESLIQKSLFSLNELSLKIGQEQTYLFQYLNREYPKRLNETARRKLSFLLNINEQELTDLELGKRAENTNINENNDLVEIEIMDVEASCGGGIENFNPVISGRHLISIRSLREITNSKAEHIKIIKARGDSMEPAINDSDVIWVDISYKSVDGDGIYVFCIGSQLIAKRARVNFLDNSVKITSDNNKYAPIDANSPETIKVAGKVISINKMLG